MIENTKIPKGGIENDVKRKDYNKKITENFEELWAKLRRTETNVTSILSVSGIMLGTGTEVRPAIPGKDYLTIERDPIFRASAQYIITKTNIDAWNQAQATIPDLQWTTAYDYDITGDRNGINVTFTLSEEYNSGSLRVHLNGLRLQKSSDLISWDYVELNNNQVVFTFAPQNGDSILIDYIKKTI